MDYRTQKNRKIAYCILDNIENQFSDYSKEVAKNVSDYFLTKLIQYDYDIFINDTSDKLLERVSQDNFYSHAVVVITGTHLRLSDRLFNSVEEKCKEMFTLAGHILDRGEAYYEIHNQFFIVNLNEYKRIGSPKMGDVDWSAVHKKIEPVRSESCVNDDKEIPIWVKKGTIEKIYQQKRHGWNFFTKGLENDAVFCDVGDDIRYNKKYLYYEHDHVFMRHVPDLFNYSLICKTMVTPWNSDSLPEWLKIDQPVDHYISTGTGLNWIYNLLNLGFKDTTKITFIDVSYPVLQFMKLLVKEWDGKDYDLFYMKHLQFIPESYNFDSESHKNNIKQWWDNFVNNFDNFENTWRKLQKLKFDFKLLDVFAPNAYNFIQPDDDTFFNLSDVYNHVPYIDTAPVKFRVARENNLIKTLQKKNANIYLYIPTRIGNFFAENKEITFGKIEDFNLWDINKFTAPPWHKNDWESYCPMTGDTRILE